MAHVILEIATYKASGQDICVATGKGDETHRCSHTRTFYDKESLIEQTIAGAHAPQSKRQGISVQRRNDKTNADEHDLQLLGVWERVGRA
jgi:hypothetical protein